MVLRTLLADPMLRMLTVAIALSLVVPATGDTRTMAQWVANVAIFALFLLNGMRIARSEVMLGLANWRFLLPLAMFVFGAMALTGFVLARLGSAFLPPLLAAGFLFLGALPSTVQSATSYTSLARGTVALSVVSAALLNILGVFVSVPIFLVLGGSGEGTLGGEALVKIFAMLILPFAIGQAVQGHTAAFTARHKGRIVWIDRFVIAIAVYVAFSGSAEQGLWQRLDAASLAILIGIVLLFIVIGHAGAWMVGKSMGLPLPDRIAFLFAGAQKSAAVGAPLATIIFPPAIAGFIVAPLLLYHLFQLVLAAPLAIRLASAAPDDCDYSESTTKS